MSLDVYLTVDQPVRVPASDGIFIRENGQKVEISREEWNRRHPDREPVAFKNEAVETNEVFSANVTHNLGPMATEAGIYEHLWRPDEIGIKAAHELIEPLRAGVAMMKSDPPRFEKLNPQNGWGSYEMFVPWVVRYLQACEKYPEAEVSVWR